MELSYVTLDVFTSKRLEGNPLAVVSVPASLKTELTQAKKQKIAQEFNLSETVFMHEPLAADDDDQKESPSPSQLQIDIFTIESELPFAGHPTIGSAVLAKFHLYPSVDTLLTKSGPIHLEAITPSGQGQGQQSVQSVRARISHDVRLHQKTLADVVPADQHASFPGLSHHVPAIRDAELRAPVVSIVRGLTFVLVELPSLDLLGRLLDGKGGPGPGPQRLDFNRLPGGGDGDGGESSSLLDPDRRQPSDFVARYYYVPIDGGDGEGVRRFRTRMLELGFEDPATGSAASTLAAYLTTVDDVDVDGSERAQRFEMTQGVEMGRRSVIRVETLANVQAGRGGEVKKIRELWLGGEAVVVQKGSLMVD